MVISLRTPTNTNARTHCFFFFSLKGKYLHRQKHTRATRKWMCNACVAKGPRGFSYWFPCSAFYAHKHGLAPGDVQMLVLFISRCCALLLLLLLLHSALSTIPLTLNNAAGNCAAASNPPPPSHSSQYQQISACSAVVKSNYAQFSVYRANTINTISPFTQQWHWMFVFRLLCSQKNLCFWWRLSSSTAFAFTRITHKNNEPAFVCYAINLNHEMSLIYYGFIFILL